MDVLRIMVAHPLMVGRPLRVLLPLMVGRRAGPLRALMLQEMLDPRELAAAILAQMKRIRNAQQGFPLKMAAILLRAAVLHRAERMVVRPADHRVEADRTLTGAARAVPVVAVELIRGNPS